MRCNNIQNIKVRDLKIQFSEGESSQNTFLEGESRTHLKLPKGMYPENNTVSSLKVMHCKKYLDESTK